MTNQYPNPTPGLQLDDLGVIKGIGPETARCLRDRGITSYAGLLTHSSDALAELLKSQTRISARRIVREDWLGQARALAQSPAVAPAGPPASLSLGPVSLHVLAEPPAFMDEPPSALRARVEFEITAAGVDGDGDQHGGYAVHILAHDMASGQSLGLASTNGRLQPGISRYGAELDFCIERAGQYTLLGTVLLLEYHTAGLALGPVVRVEP